MSFLKINNEIEIIPYNNTDLSESDKNNQLIVEYLEKYQNLPAQRTTEWKESRKLNIGGSEIATVIGDNNFKSSDDLILDKIGYNKQFTGSIITRWGNVMEEAVKIYFENTLGIIIHEVGGIPYESPITTFDSNRLRYSPDGITTIKYVTNVNNSSVNKDNNTITTNYSQSIILLEFKCPSERKIKKGEVPSYYLPQPKMGLCVIPITEFALFIECSIKPCTFKQYNINDTSCEQKLLGSRSSVSRTCEMISKGLIGIYINTEYYELVNSRKLTDSGSLNPSEYNDFFSELELIELLLEKFSTKCEYVDISSDKLIFDKFFSIDFGHLNKNLIMLRYSNPLEKIDNFYNCEEDIYSLVGILCYKILEISINKIEKDENFIRDNEKCLNNYFNKLDSAFSDTQNYIKKNVVNDIGYELVEE